MSRFVAAILAIAVAVPLFADRVRVIVAVEVPEISALAAASLRAQVIDSLATATHVVPWGRGRAFAAEVDRDELDLLRHDPRVLAVSLDEGGKGALLQSLPLVGVNTVRAQGFDGRGVTVAVLDTGIDANNPDFAGRVVAQQCFCDNGDGSGCCPSGVAVQSGNGSAADDHGHGTHVAGIIAGGGVSAPAGVAPAAQLVAMKVMDAENRFRSFTQIYQALEWIALHRPDVRVINMSLGSHALFSTRDCRLTAVAWGMAEVVATLRARGVLIAASSGNDGSITGTTLPACMDDVLGIGATYDSSGNFTAFCSAPAAHVDQVTCFTNSTDAIDLVAPGSPIVASRRGGGSIVYSGTSMAAPHVAGALALMQQASGGKLTADQSEQILESTGKRVVDLRNGLAFPRLDVAAAIAATPRPTPAPRRRSVKK